MAAPAGEPGHVARLFAMLAQGFSIAVGQDADTYLQHGGGVAASTIGKLGSSSREWEITTVGPPNTATTTGSTTCFANAVGHDDGGDNGADGGAVGFSHSGPWSINWRARGAGEMGRLTWRIT